MSKKKDARPNKQLLTGLNRLDLAAAEFSELREIFVAMQVSKAVKGVIDLLSPQLKKKQSEITRLLSLCFDPETGVLNLRSVRDSIFVQNPDPLLPNIAVDPQAPQNQIQALAVETARAGDQLTEFWNSCLAQKPEEKKEENKAIGEKKEKEEAANNKEMSFWHVGEKLTGLCFDEVLSKCPEGTVLKEIRLSSKVKCFLVPRPLSNRPGLQEFYVAHNPHFRKLETIALKFSIYGCENVTSAVASKATFGDHRECGNLTSVILPSVLNGDGHGCKKLVSAIIPAAEKADYDFLENLEFLQADVAKEANIRGCKKLARPYIPLVRILHCNGAGVTELTLDHIQRMQAIQCPNLRVIAISGVGVVDDIQVWGNPQLVEISGKSAIGSLSCSQSPNLETVDAPFLKKGYLHTCPKLKKLHFPLAGELVCDDSVESVKVLQGCRIKGAKQVKIEYLAPEKAQEEAQKLIEAMKVSKARKTESKNVVSENVVKESSDIKDPVSASTPSPNPEKPKTETPKEPNVRQ
jgi:hypothetical protein